jgi:hypothetical protein
MAFADDIALFVSKTKAKLRLTNQEVILAVAGSLVGKSPVGDPATWESKPGKTYVPGTFKANWRGGFNAVDYTTTDETDPTGELSLVAVSAAMPDDPTGVFYITNSLPYAEALEDGHSKQAPVGMVGLTVLEFDQIAAASILKVSQL